jgi:hypothetical protein
MELLTSTLDDGWEIREIVLVEVLGMVVDAL